MSGEKSHLGVGGGVGKEDSLCVIGKEDTLTRCGRVVCREGSSNVFLAEWIPELRDCQGR